MWSAPEYSKSQVSIGLLEPALCDLSSYIRYNRQNNLAWPNRADCAIWGGENGSVLNRLAMNHCALRVTPLGGLGELGCGTMPALSSRQEKNHHGRMRRLTVALSGAYTRQAKNPIMFPAYSQRRRQSASGGWHSI